MMNELTIARSELILGGQRSGKSRRAELLARTWLAESAQHKAVLIATAQAWDDEMRVRITQHQRDRAERVPGMQTVEEPLQLADAIQTHSRPDTLLVVDCLTLWLTNWLMPAGPHPSPLPEGEGTRENSLPEGAGTLNAHVLEGEGMNSSLSLWERAGVRATGLAGQTTQLQQALRNAPGTIVLVSNEIGLGVIPMGADVRTFVDALGRLNQEVAQVCERVTLMAAGLPLVMKGAA
jgi:adenosylcobinamide kinase / adenosylcobinamide-phosphate guanylyltransferase